MPNNIVSKVVAKGTWKDLSQFSQTIVGRDQDDADDLIFDFNKIIAMPESFNDTSNDEGPTMGWVAWYGSDADLRKVLAYEWAKGYGLTTRAKLQKYLKSKEPYHKAQADILQSNLKKYGVMNAYDWHIRYWGTKWNSWGFNWVKEGGPKEWRPGPSEISFRFTTAWSPPEPIFHAMAEKFPELEFFVATWTGEYGCEGHFVEGSGSFDCGEATPELYEEIFGEPMPPEMLE